MKTTIEKIIENEIKRSPFGVSGFRRAEIKQRFWRYERSDSPLTYQEWDMQTFLAENPDQEGRE